jgi:hypothetical protein
MKTELLEGKIGFLGGEKETQGVEREIFNKIWIEDIPLQIEAHVVMDSIH